MTVTEGGVSVVVTTYNDTRYLDDALASIIKQTTHPIETIVVDDGSEDDPSVVTGRYAGIRLIRQSPLASPLPETRGSKLFWHLCGVPRRGR